MRSRPSGGESQHGFDGVQCFATFTILCVYIDLHITSNRCMGLQLALGRTAVLGRLSAERAGHPGGQEVRILPK